MYEHICVLYSVVSVHSSLPSRLNPFRSLFSFYLIPIICTVSLSFSLSITLCPFFHPSFSVFLLFSIAIFSIPPFLYLDLLYNLSPYVSFSLTLSVSMVSKNTKGAGGGGLFGGFFGSKSKNSIEMSARSDRKSVV